MQNNALIKNANSFIDNIPLNDNESYILIEIDKRIYGFLAKDVLEVTKISELDYPDEMPCCILGFIKYNQKPAAVFDLREVFKLDRITYNLSAKIIVLKAQDSICSIICDKILDIKKLDSKKIHILPYQKVQHFFNGLYINEQENIYIVNQSNIVKYISDNKDKFPTGSKDKNYIVDDEKSKQVLRDRKNFIAKISTEVQETKPLYDMGVSFIINDIKYYINMNNVKEFFKVNNSKFIKVPYTKDYILGLINIKGDYITVVDIRSFFNSSKTTIKEKSTIIILNSPEYKIGILADEICESMNINFDEILQNKLQNQDTNTIEFVKDNEIYQVIDVDKLLSDERLTIC